MVAFIKQVFGHIWKYSTETLNWLSFNSPEYQELSLNNG